MTVRIDWTIVASVVVGSLIGIVMAVIIWKVVLPLLAVLGVLIIDWITDGLDVLAEMRRPK